MKFIVLGIALALSFPVFADDEEAEDIYPEMFIDDCSYSLVTDTTKNKDDAAMQNTGKCSCLANKFFSSQFEDTADAYQDYMYVLKQDFISIETRNEIKKNMQECGIMSDGDQYDEK